MEQMEKKFKIGDRVYQLANRGDYVCIDPGTISQVICRTTERGEKVNYKIYRAGDWGGRTIRPTLKIYATRKEARQAIERYLDAFHKLPVEQQHMVQNCDIRAPRVNWQA